MGGAMSREKTDSQPQFDTEQRLAILGFSSLHQPKPLGLQPGGLIKRRDLLKRVRTTG